MSFDATLLQPRKQRKSCDGCRVRKLRCDDPVMPEGRCPNCLSSGTPCTYSQRVRRRGAKNSLVEELRQEITSLKGKLRSLSICSLCAQPLSQRPEGESPPEHASVFNHTAPQTETTAKKPPEDDSILDELASRFSQFQLESQTNKYFGSGGGYALANEAMAMKEIYLGRPVVAQTRRRIVWDVLPWEKEAFPEPPNYVYPPSDLVVSLLQLYFTIIHPTFPVLHRPSFGTAYGEGLHFKSVEFGGLLLAVLAVASRYSDDPRVFVDGDTSLSSGWRFANQVETGRKLLQPSTLYEIQTYCLLAFFSLGTSVPQNGWLFLGIGSRFLQQSGQHQRKRENGKLNLEDERWKRTFWSFAAMDRMVSLFVGRPSAFLFNYDVDLPLEVDDEYWDRGFTQPLGRPSLNSYFFHHARLFEILGDAMVRLHGSKKMKLAGWDGPEWEQRTVADLDSAMNDFFNSIPAHLRWDPNNPSQGPFFDQSATLNVLYHYVQIAIHRPYIYKRHGLVAPSLFICARAARTILHTADIWFKRQQRPALPDLINPVFLAGVILVLIAFGTRCGLSESIDTEKDLAQVETAMTVLKCAESRWQPAGRLLEILRELRSLDPPPATDPSTDGLESTSSAQPTAPGVSPANILDSHYAQPAETFTGQPWDNTLSFMSIEQLLADADPLDAMNDFIASLRGYTP